MTVRQLFVFSEILVNLRMRPLSHPKRCPFLTFWRVEVDRPQPLYSSSSVNPTLSLVNSEADTLSCLTRQLQKDATPLLPHPLVPVPLYVPTKDEVETGHPPKAVYSPLFLMHPSPCNAQARFLVDNLAPNPVSFRLIPLELQRLCLLLRTNKLPLLTVTSVCPS